MKKYIFTLLFVLGSHLAWGQTVETRSYLGNTFGLVDISTFCFNKITGSENRIVANQWIDSLEYYSDQQLKFLSKLKVYDNNSQLRTTSINYIKYLNTLSKKQLPEFYRFAFNTSYSDKDRKTYERLIPAINEVPMKLYEEARIEADKYKTKYNLLEPAEFNLEYEEKTSFDTATQYNDYIVDRCDKVDELWTLAIEEETMSYALAWSELMAEAADKGIKSLEKLKTFEPDMSFKDAALAYFTHMRSIAQNELPEFIRIIRADEMTVAGEQRAEALIPALDDTRERLFDNIEVCQERFADTANFRIEGKEIPLIYNYTDISTFEDAAAYNDYVVNMIDIIDHYWTLAIEEENMEKALSFSDSLNFYSLKAISTLGKLGSFKGYDLFRTAGIDYATHMSKISSNELKEFLRIIRAAKMNTKQEKRAESLIPVLDDEREKLFDLVEKAQNEYASRFDIIIVK